MRATQPKNSNKKHYRQRKQQKHNKTEKLEEKKTEKHFFIDSELGTGKSLEVCCQKMSDVDAGYLYLLLLLLSCQSEPRFHLLYADAECVPGSVQGWSDP